MKKYINKALGLATSATARDTYVLFTGNIVSAFLGFVFTLFAARALSVSDFGVLSAAINLIIIISSLTDLGISSGLVNFVSVSLSHKDQKKADEYSKAALAFKLVVSLPLILFVVFSAGFVAQKWLATGDKTISYWVAGISLIAIFWGVLPYILQAEKKFVKSVLIDISLSFPKAVIPYAFLLFGLLNLQTALLSFAIGAGIAGVTGFVFVGTKFLKAKPGKNIYLDLIKFSGWLGVNRIISSISGKLDIQMLAAIAGATAAGLYSIPAKLASFIVVLASSFSAVLAPRLASFGNKDNERRYLIKATLVLIPMVVGVIIWIIIAKPFIVFLFGIKYLPSVPVFQALAASTIPFLLSVPSVSAIIYSMKKTVFIGLFSFFQLASIFALNYIFIPRIGPFGPTIAFGVVNSVLAIFTWAIVIKHYWFKE